MQFKSLKHVRQVRDLLEQLAWHASGEEAYWNMLSNPDQFSRKDNNFDAEFDHVIAGASGCYENYHQTLVVVLQRLSWA